MISSRVNACVFASAAICAGAFLQAPAAMAKTVEVNQSAPNASDGRENSGGAPFKTINAALNFAGPGDTVLVKPGVYRETILLKKGGTQDNPLRIVSAEKHGATISGADIVTDWTGEGGGVISFKMKGAPFVNPIVFGADDGKRIPGNQLFVNKRPLTWNDKPGALKPGEWHLDIKTGDVRAFMPFGIAAKDSLIEFSVRPGTLFAFDMNVDYVTIDGLHFTNAADNKVLPRSLQISGKGWQIKNVLSDWNI